MLPASLKNAAYCLALWAFFISFVFLHLQAGQLFLVYCWWIRSNCISNLKIPLGCKATNAAVWTDRQLEASSMQNPLKSRYKKGAGIMSNYCTKIHVQLLQGICWSISKVFVVLDLGKEGRKIRKRLGNPSSSQPGPLQPSPHLDGEGKCEPLEDNLNWRRSILGCEVA